jgi:transcriptional regulator with XRE-family HTH domain
MREEAHKTQAEVAAALGTEQGEISRVERREDVRLSTLRRYAEAIGAECEVVFVFAKTGRAITLADPLSGALTRET